MFLRALALARTVTGEFAAAASGSAVAPGAPHRHDCPWIRFHALFDDVPVCADAWEASAFNAGHAMRKIGYTAAVDVYFSVSVRVSVCVRESARPRACARLHDWFCTRAHWDIVATTPGL